MPRLQWTRASSATLLALVGPSPFPPAPTTKRARRRTPARSRGRGHADGRGHRRGDGRGPAGGHGHPGRRRAGLLLRGQAAADADLHAGQEQELQDAVNTLAECTTIQLGAGTFTFDNALTIRQNGITIVGAGKGAQGEGTGGSASTVLVFTNAAGEHQRHRRGGQAFTVRDLALWNAKKDALRIESSTNVIIQRIRTEWAQENNESNGKYGIYPVKSSSTSSSRTARPTTRPTPASTWGRRSYAIVRSNIAKQNVAGIEIENTKFAYVQGNIAQDNTAGLVVFDLPGNPIKGTDIRVHGQHDHGQQPRQLRLRDGQQQHRVPGAGRHRHVHPRVAPGGVRRQHLGQQQHRGHRGAERPGHRARPHAVGAGRLQLRQRGRLHPRQHLQGWQRRHGGQRPAGPGAPPAGRAGGGALRLRRRDGRA